MAKQRSKKHGFTLVELSIALVIIGLLIGGILVGQSIVEAAKINKEVSRLTQYSIAFVNFRQKFKQEAGDTTLFPNPGNNDSDTYDTISACPAGDANIEYHTNWSHLSQAQMLKETYTFSSANLCNTNYKGMMPLTKISNYSIITPIHSYYSKSGYAIINNPHLRVFNAQYDFYMTYALDNKLDDNSITTGRLIATTASGSNYCTAQDVQDEIDNTGTTDRHCAINLYYGTSPEMPLD